MNTIPHVVSGLRTLLEEGATPSRLIQYIASQHSGDEHCLLLVQEYFAAAFFIPIMKIPNDWSAFRHGDSRHWSMNLYLLHQIIANRHKWSADPESAGSGRTSWLDSLVATDDLQAKNEANPGGVPELAKDWPMLSPAGKKEIQRMMGQSVTTYEQAVILARLAEQLQQRVVELESQITERAFPC